MARAAACLLFVLLLPISILVAIALFASSPGTIVFRQERIGLHKVPFTVFKFRTMSNGKVTFAGRVIRKLGLDEIPQFINIAKGEMSFVGPRPLTQFDIERLGWNTDSHSERWSVLPGITGPAQLTNVCNASLSLSKDLEYVKRKSATYDTKILLRSAMVPLIGKHTS